MGREEIEGSIGAAVHVLGFLALFGAYKHARKLSSVKVLGSLGTRGA
jgi:hypothetical protein